MTYQFLLFDLDHTLLDFDKAEDMALTALLKECKVTDVQAYKDYYSPMNKAMWRGLELKLLSKKELVNTRFTKLFEHFGHTVDGVYLAERYQAHLKNQGQSYPGAKALLETLKAAGFAIYAATNGLSQVQTSRLEKSGLAVFFEKVFVSESSGSQKPDKAFYDWIGDQIPNFNPAEALMIGDSLTADIQGGINAGIDTVWYNPKCLDNQSSVHPTYQVSHYQELLAILHLDETSFF
ncbi:YjjG family noncanonical pyrimidine nucleotidase [Streptococcus pseudoporcinus]|uniref:Haloacid dehalogenase n=1 Tax=Streptococcus pseudoporcinus TaxID=361101 RepID=A0A4U9XSE9_9STRE|nr:YjjG family noncanonical pyrimidine nucleotidase [Streptococcus pseudoporcinus]VTS15675.1 haloacid dehalogenase [Streptococcus pseudoporcinus]VUC67686.1 haloacid dehalogenase [Streptococcus pseudoporcinus]VUC98610.1 haloacid dehalogenase [Streptococcus pseudoporcinus]VUC99003.1 haloacid dehalogenase [Streptococcus pseudoporcinus]